MPWPLAALTSYALAALTFYELVTYALASYAAGLYALPSCELTSCARVACSSSTATVCAAVSGCTAARSVNITGHNTAREDMDDDYDVLS